MYDYAREIDEARAAANYDDRQERHGENVPSKAELRAEGEDRKR